MNTAAMAASHAFWTDESGDRARTVFAAEGIRCASCSRSIERAVSALPGIERINVNVATSRVCVDWNPSRSQLAQILKAVAEAGFKPIPLAGEAAEDAFRSERRDALKRIGLAGLGMMQVMMYVSGVYAARSGDIDPAIATYLRYVGMVITAPVLLYSGMPFLRGAWHDLRRRALGMDVPVALALLLAFAASVFNTLRGAGQTYFDSVTMFIFFLGAGRYVELVVRQRSLSVGEAVARSLPATVLRLKADGTTERVPVASVVAGDRLQIPKGGVIPVDSTLADGTALVDESLVTGESKPQHRAAGGRLLGGSLSVGQSVRVVALSDVRGSTLASVVALLERAQGVRPPVARAADRTANWFIAVILIIASLVAVAWMFVDPSRAFPAALAVLVVTCPCALSLATPVAVAAASTRLARAGLLVTRADALERLAQVDAVVLDKTGTLTSGGMAVARTTMLGMPMHGSATTPGAPSTLGTLSESDALAVAAALERGSSHPIAAVFRAFEAPAIQATEVTETPGLGIEGIVSGQRWRIGRHDFVAGLAPCEDAGVGADIGVYLGSASGPIALFELGEDVRPDAFAAIQRLQSLGVEAVIASGDGQAAVEAARSALHIERASARLAPADKVTLVRELQAQGKRVLAVGDGVNDGPALAAANVSCAMGQGSAIAQAAADFLLLNDALDGMATGIATARRMFQIIRQNLRWALIYNFAAVPLAAFDLIPPWLAAIGMSASSMIVVLNARRLAASEKGAR